MVTTNKLISNLLNNMENEINMENKLELNRRPAEEKDTEFARQVHHRAYHDVVVRQFGSFEEKAQDKFFESAWKGSKHEIIYANGKPCGYFSMDESENEITLHELVLLPEFQGEGIGSKILSEVIEVAKVKNIPIRLEVLKENKAGELYRRLGFKQNGETETHFQMEKLIK